MAKTEDESEETDAKRDISDLRAEIDAINTEMAELFRRRMAVSSRIAGYKREHGLPVSDPRREQEILEKIGAQAGSELAEYARTVFRTLFEVSKAYQQEKLSDGEEQ